MIALVGRDKTIEVRDFSSRALQTRFPTKEGEIVDVEVTKNGNFLLVERLLVVGKMPMKGGLPARSKFEITLEIWDLHTETLKRKLKPGYSAWAVRRDGSILAVGDQNGKIEFWDSAKNELSATIPSQNRAITSLALSNGGKSLAVCFLPARAELWDVANRKITAELAGNVGRVTNFAFNKDDKTVASADIAGNIRLWDTSSGREIVCFCGGSVEIAALEFSRDDKMLASVNVNGGIHIWDLTISTQKMRISKGHSIIDYSCWMVQRNHYVGAIGALCSPIDTSLINSVSLLAPRELFVNLTKAL